nr:membrane protein [Piscirickettsiaceae bacterium]
MYDAIIGGKGSGKSYNTVATVILPALRKGRTVVTNIPLTDEIDKDPELIGTVIPFDINELQWYGESHTPQAVRDFFNPENIHKGAIYVLDEVHKLWPAGMQVSEFPKDQKNFISEHRHMVGPDGHSTDVVLVTQDTKQIAAYPRRLLDYIYVCKKMSALGMQNSYRVDIFEGEVSLHETFKGTKVNTLRGKYDPEIYKYYRSHTQNESFHDSGLESVNENNSVFKNSLFRIGVPFGILSIAFAVYLVLDMFFSMGKSEPDPEQTSVSEPVKPSVVQVSNSSKSNQVSQPAQDQPDQDNTYYSKDYRISHFYKSISRSVVFITDNNRFYPYPLHLCEFKPYDGLTCDFNGEKVTYFSGEVPSYDKGKNSFTGTTN